MPDDPYALLPNDPYAALPPAKPKVPKGYAVPKPKPTQLGALAGIGGGIVGKPTSAGVGADVNKKRPTVIAPYSGPSITDEQQAAIDAKMESEILARMPDDKLGKYIEDTYKGSTVYGTVGNILGGNVLQIREKLLTERQRRLGQVGSFALPPVIRQAAAYGLNFPELMRSSASTIGHPEASVGDTIAGTADVVPLPFAEEIVKGAMFVAGKASKPVANLIRKALQSGNEKQLESAIQKAKAEGVDLSFRPKTETPSPKTPEAPKPASAKPTAGKAEPLKEGAWREVKEGEGFEAGREFKMDMSTGKNYVKVNAAEAKASAKPVAPKKPKAEPPVAKSEPEASGISRSSRAIMADLYGTNKPVTIGGKKHEVLLKEGREQVDKGFDFEGEAAKLAEAGQPASDAQIGILAAGRDKLIEDLNRLNKRIDGGDKTARAEKDALMDRIAAFDRNIDEVKASGGRGLAAYKIGHTVNWADLDEVKLEASRWKETALTTGDEKALKSAVEKLKTAEAKASKLESEVADLRAGSVSRPKQTRGARTVEQIQKNREAIFKEIDDVLKGAAKVHDIGSVVYESARFGKAAGKLAWSYAHEGVARMDDIVERVIKDLGSRGIKIDRQQIIDEMGDRQTAPRTKTEIEKQIATLRAEAKRESTGGKRLKDEKAQMRHAERMFDYEEKIADLRNQLATGNYRLPEPRENKLTAELARAKEEADLLRAKVQTATRHIGAGRNAVDVLTDVVGIGKVVTLGADFGALLRQGLHGIPHLIANPASYGRAVKSIGQAMKSDAGLYKLEMASLERRLPDGRLAEKVRRDAGLSRSSIISEREEGQLTRLLDHLVGGTIGRIPGLKGIGGALGRGQAGFLNTLRNEMFDSFAMRHPDATAKELKNHANFINSALGRSASYGSKKTPHEAAQIIFTSPRYEASRWEMVGNYAASPVTAVKALKDKAARAKIINMATTAGTVLGTLKIAAAATDGELILDPDSSDFLKLRIGDKVIDMTAGIAPRLRGMLRFIFYVKDPSASTKIRKSDGQPYKRNETLPSEILKTTTRPVSPTITGGVEERTGYSLSGWREDEGDPQGWERLMPLIAQGFKQDLEKGGWKEAAQNAAIEFLGGSVQRYEKPK